MTATSPGSIRLFRFAGINVFLHSSWFLIAIIEISGRGQRYPSLVWNVAEYIVLFVIVLLHEFGHALACRQVGGKAEMIVLWPLGGTPTLIRQQDQAPRSGVSQPARWST